ncbi:hypothetical protein [Massilia sp. HP4]|uniref:hypothetical protein n=1 Tax=Massilia sp. HP4 TaxID=2562316 RepID=UPI0010C05A3A|nr:hypothetical protein [Massilia sp. HP4]
MNQDPAFDASIPVLTEVVAESSTPQVPSAPVTPVLSAAPVAATNDGDGGDPDSPEGLERRAADRWSGEQWSVMERRLTERVLQQLQGRIDFVLEQRLRDGIAEAVDKAMAGFSAEIRTSLHDTLGQAVTRAVSQEISHLQNLGK